MRGRSRGFDESDLLDAALRVFWRRGYHGASTAEILDEAGVGRQSLYNLYPSKREVFLAVLTRYEHTVIGRLVGILERPAPLPDVAAEAVAALRKSSEKLSGSGCLFGNAVTGGLIEDDAIRERVERGFARLHAAALDAARRATADARTRATPESIALATLTLIEGAAVTGRLGDPRKLEDAVRAAVAAMLGG